ncbi:MAG: hemerythrin domain-containing protein [Breznakibacter sp.]
MVITSDMKMADVVMLDIQLLAVIQRLEIPLGFREKTVAEVCGDHDVDVNFFIQLANTFRDKDYSHPESFMAFSATSMVKYLRTSHRCYVDHRVPAIEEMIIDLENDLGKDSNAELLLNFFREYVREFHAHLELEEKVVFPYVLMLKSCIDEGKILSEFNERFNNYYIDKYLEDHNDIEEKLFDLKNILLKYMPPPTNSCKYNNLIFELFRLEDDLKDHSNLEDKVFIPRVKSMEKELKKIIKAGK